jgi:hypothetical protein
MPTPWACSGIRAAVRPPVAATESQTAPNRAPTVATILAVRGVSVHGQTSLIASGSANATSAATVTAPPTAPSASRTARGSGTSGGAARRWARSSSGRPIGATA